VVVSVQLKLAQANSDKDDMTVFAKYVTGPVSVGIQKSELTGGATGATEQDSLRYSVAFNINENLSCFLW
jgi:hypothetical protein